MVGSLIGWGGGRGGSGGGAAFEGSGKRMVVSSKKAGVAVGATDDSIRSRKHWERITSILAWLSLAINLGCIGWYLATTSAEERITMGREMDGLSALPGGHAPEAAGGLRATVNSVGERVLVSEEPSRSVRVSPEYAPKVERATAAPATATAAVAATGAFVEVGPPGEVVVFHQECLRYQDWQAVGLAASHAAHAGTDSRLLRLLSCGEQTKDGRRSAAETVLGVETVEVKGHSDVKDGYVVRHKPHAVNEWVQGHDIEEETVVIVDPDMLWMRPLGVRAERGVLKSPYYAIGALWAKERTPSAQVCHNIGKACTGLKKDASDAFQVGVPYILHRDDLKALSPLWVSRLDELKEAGEDSWCSDMYAFSLAAMEVGLRVETLNGVSVHSAEMNHPESLFVSPASFDQDTAEFLSNKGPALVHYPMELNLGISQSQGKPATNFVEDMSKEEVAALGWDKGVPGEMWNKHDLHDRDFVACAGVSEAGSTSVTKGAPDTAPPCVGASGTCAESREQKRAWIDEAFSQHCTHPVEGRTSAAMAWMCKTVTQTLAAALLAYDDAHCV